MPHTLASYLEVITAAKQNQHFEDFKTGGRLTGDIRAGYQARMAAFSVLSEQGFIKLDSGLLVLGELSPESWLTDGLRNGENASWQICDAFPARARKFKPDLFNLEEIGREGEEYVVSWLKSNLEPELHASVVHVALSDDTAGYDISSPSANLPSRILLEVKTSTRVGTHFSFHLSRNEWATAARNPNWYLVLVSKANGNLSFFGYLDGKSLVGYYPKDSHQDFQWTSVVGKLGPDDVYEGVPGF